MSSEQTVLASSPLKVTAKILTITAFITSLIVLGGWIFNIEFLKRGVPDAIAMNPLSIICFLLCATSLWLRNNKYSGEKSVRYAKRMALVVAAIGLLKITAMIARIDFHLDTIMFHDRLWEPARNDFNRMAPNTAFCFLLMGLSVFWLDKDFFGRRRPAQYFSILSMFLAILTLYGYVYGVKFLYGIANYIPMSLLSGFNFLLLSVAILFSRPEKGTMAIIIGDTSAEITLLRLAAFIIPLVMGWLKLKGEELGYYTTEFGTAVFAVVTYALAMFLLGRRSVVNHKLRLMRKQAELIVRENARKLQSILDHSPTTIYIKNLDGSYALINKQFEKLFNVSQEQVIGRHDHEIFSGEIAKAFARNDSEVKEQLHTVYAEEEFSATGEEPSCYLSVKFPLTDGEGKIQAICGIATDITKRKHLERSLRESEERSRLIVNTSLDAFIGMDSDGLITDWNPQAEVTFGWKKEEVLGKTIAETIVPERYRTRHQTGLKHFIATDEGPVMNKRIEIEGLHRSGKEFPIELEITYLQIENTLVFCAFAHDISERIKARMEIKRTNHFLNAILENIPDMIFVKDAKELRFVRFNKAGENLLGYSREDLIGKNDYDFFPKEQADFFTKKDREVMEKKEVVDIPEEPIDTNAGKRWLHTKKITLFDDDKNPLYLLGISEDITERKQSGEALRESEQLLHSVTESINEGIMIYGKDGKLILFNAKAEEFISKDVPNHLPEHWLDAFYLYHPDGKQPFHLYELLFKRALEGEKIENLELLARNKESGIEKNLLASSRPVRDSGDRIIAALVNFRDISETRKLEQLLDELKIKYQQLAKPSNGNSDK